MELHKTGYPTNKLNTNPAYFLVCPKIMQNQLLEICAAYIEVSRLYLHILLFNSNKKQNSL